MPEIRITRPHHEGQGQSQVPQQEAQRVIELSYDASAYTNTYNYTLLFSMKQRRFIKPVLEKHLRVWYKILPGTYMRLHSAGHRSEDVMDVRVELIRINENGEEEVLKTANWTVYMNGDWTNCPKIITDFVAGRPGYHSYPVIDFTKVYSVDDVNRTLNGGVCGEPEASE